MLPIEVLKNWWRLASLSDAEDDGFWLKEVFDPQGEQFTEINKEQYCYEIAFIFVFKIYKMIRMF